MDFNRALSKRVRAYGAAALAAGLCVSVGLGAVASTATAATQRATPPQLQSVTVKPYSGILANSKKVSLYLLTVEKGGKLHCTGICLTYWQPLLVPTATKSIPVAKSVKGKIGFVKRTSRTKQVTFNGYPVYHYTGDSGPNQVKGEGTPADGGTWYLVNAATTSVSSTPVKPKG